MKTKRMVVWMALAALLVGVPSLWAQQRDTRVNSPVEPLPPLPAGERNTAGEATKDLAEAGDVRRAAPLSSAEDWTTAGWGPRRSYVLASFSLYQGGDTNPEVFGKNHRIQSVTNFGADLALHQLWRRQELTTVYTGGGSFYSELAERNNTYHQLRVTHKITGRRWTLVLSDLLNYSPDATRGLGSLTRPSQVSALLQQGGIDDAGNLNPSLVPSQSVLTTRVPRLGNTVMGEMQYQVGARSSLTASASYGLLHFFEPGFVGNSNLGFRSGYNYALTGRDTIGVSYGGNLLRFENTPLGVNSHTVELAYGRQISERFALHLAGGPQVSTFSGVGGALDPQVGWSANTSMSYRMQRTILRLGYNRAVTGGSGVLMGAQTDQVRMGLSHRLSRVWSVNWNLGYAHNERLRRLSLPGQELSFHSYFGGVSLYRNVGRYSRMYVSYQVQRQSREAPGCSGPTCGLNGIRHVFGIGFNFRFRPIDVE